MTPDDPLLMAYADGQLDPETAAHVAARVAADPALARAVERHRRLAGLLSGAHAAALAEPVPAALEAALARGEGRAKVVPIRPRRWAAPEWMAIAASLLVGVLVSQAWPDGEGGPLRHAEVGLVADGWLSRALDRSVAGEPVEPRVQVGISFMDAQGAYCRAFALRTDRPLAGLACREGGRWRVGILEETAKVDAEGLRQAATPLPPAVLEAIDRRIAGEPLDADAERAARAAGWR